MAIETHEGCTVITGEHIELYRMLALKGALSLELRGMKHSSGYSAYAAAKKIYGLQGGRIKVYHSLIKLIDEKFPGRREGCTNRVLAEE